MDFFFLIHALPCHVRSRAPTPSASFAFVCTCGVAWKLERPKDTAAQLSTGTNGLALAQEPAESVGISQMCR